MPRSTSPCTCEVDRPSSDRPACPARLPDTIRPARMFCPTERGGSPTGRYQDGDEIVRPRPRSSPESAKAKCPPGRRGGRHCPSDPTRQSIGRPLASNTAGLVDHFSNRLIGNGNKRQAPTNATCCQPPQGEWPPPRRPLIARFLPIAMALKSSVANGYPPRLSQRSHRVVVHA